MNTSHPAQTAFQPQRRARRLKIAAILGGLSAFGPLSIDMYLPALPALTADLQTSASLVQLSLTACMLGLSLGQLFAGPLSDLRGRRIPLIAGLLLYAVASCLCVLAPSIEALVALRFVQGLAGSAGIVISRAVVRDLYSGTELTRFYALLMLVNGSAPILAPIVGGQLLHVTVWRGVFAVLAALGLLMLAAVLLGLPETLPAERRTQGGFAGTLRAFRSLLSDRRFMGYALSQGLAVAAMFAYISGSPFVIQNKFGASPQLFSLIFAMNGLGIIIAGQLTGRLAGRFHESRLFASGITLALAGGLALFAVILAGAGLPAILPALFVVVSCVGIITTSGFSLAMQNYGQSAGSASALLGLLSFVFGGIAAPLVGLGGGAAAVPMGTVIAVCETGSVLSYVLLVRGRVRKG